MIAFELSQEFIRHQLQDSLYSEFLTTQNLSVGIYELPSGDNDPQQPHTEDEVYLVLKGKGKIRVSEEARDVAPGSVVYVSAGLDHKFFDIIQTLTILVIFSPARGTQIK